MWVYIFEIVVFDGLGVPLLEVATLVVGRTLDRTVGRELDDPHDLTTGIVIDG